MLRAVILSCKGVFANFEFISDKKQIHRKCARSFFFPFSSTFAKKGERGVSKTQRLQSGGGPRFRRPVPDCFRSTLPGLRHDLFAGAHLTKFGRQHRAADGILALVRVLSFLVPLAYLVRGAFCGRRCSAVHFTQRTGIGMTVCLSGVRLPYRPKPCRSRSLDVVVASVR